MSFKIYTKTGDDGSTGLFGGARVAKHNARVEAYGTVDELNAHVGAVADYATEEAAFLRQIQSRLFSLGAVLATQPDKPNLMLNDLQEQDLSDLETAIDKMESELPPLKNFILPGGHIAVSTAHLARCVCRRAERLVVALAEITPVPKIVLAYLNRLSDYLFVLSRYMAMRLGVVEIVWKGRS
jgi:cob(I)alamin adenosyltransferase